jgi:CRP/FNR family cyclic AMP-dependent transcriptional regulator
MDVSMRVRDDGFMSASLPSHVVQKFAAGSRLVVENDSSSRRMYIIRTGKVRVYKNYLNQRITLAILGAGEVFGEMSFFDAEPRSASVEALTEVTAVVLDGEVAKRELAGLPEWIYPIFRTVFHRFREMDSRMTVLQSMNEFQKRAFRTDNVAKTIYLDILRFIKTLKILYERDQGAHGVVKSQTLCAELDDVLGVRTIGLRVFWRMLKEFDFIDNAKEEGEGVVVLNDAALKALNDYIVGQVKAEDFLLLSHSSLAVLARIVGFTHADEQAAQGVATVTVSFADIALEKVPLYEEALLELTNRKILKISKDNFLVHPGEIYHLFTFQSILKAFDHTMVNLE